MQFCLDILLWAVQRQHGTRLPVQLGTMLQLDEPQDKFLSMS